VLVEQKHERRLGPSTRWFTLPDDESLQQAPVGVQKIEVEALFGHFDYLLRSETANLSDLFILYGDNGSGKTTILNILFHVLSPAPNRGHRTALLDFPFKRFAVFLVDGTEITLSRKEAGTGPYMIDISEAHGSTRNMPFGMTEGRERQFGSPEEQELFRSMMNDMGLTVYLLSADRRIQSDAIWLGDEDDEHVMIRTGEGAMRRQRKRSRSDEARTGFTKTSSNTY
jgi:energy-coupling factor transporter ATP-binding protein EcfA2